MDKLSTGLAILIVALLIGSGVLGYALHPAVKVVTQDKEVPVEKIVEKEVVKNVSVPLDLQASYVDPAIKELKQYISDEEDMQVCDGATFDEDQIVVKNVGDEVTIASDEDETSVTLSATLKYLDKDVEEKCYKDIDFKVTYEADEEPVVEIL